MVLSANEIRDSFWDKQDQLAALEEKAISLSKIEKNAISFNKETDSIIAALPDNPEVSQFIVQLENLSTEKQILIKNLSIAENSTGAKAAQPTKTGANNTQFSFDISTDYPALAGLIDRLERFPRFISIDSINLLLTEDQNIAAKISGRIYYGK